MVGSRTWTQEGTIVRSHQDQAVEAGKQGAASGETSHGKMEGWLLKL